MASDSAASRPHVTGIAPWLSVANATQAVKFYKAGFGAEELERLEDEPGYIVVARLALGDVSFWVQQDPDASPDPQDGKIPVRMIVTVDDPDAMFAQAVAAGATVVSAVHEEQGWRVGRIADLSGHHWEFATPLGS